MTIKDLIGFQMVSITEEKIVVRKDGVEHVLDIVEYEGDCCGFNTIERLLMIDAEELSRNPVITDIVRRDPDYGGEGDACEITFFGESKPLAALNTYSRRGSGWQYGATVRIVCKPIGLDETLSSW